MVLLRKGLRELKGRTACVFVIRCKSGLFTMKFHLSDHLSEDLDKVRSVSFLDASAYEHVSIVFKRAYKRTYIKRGREWNARNVLCTGGHR